MNKKEQVTPSLVMRRVEGIYEAATYADHATAHEMEAALFVVVLKEIASGSPYAMALAHEALKSLTIPFNRDASERTEP